MRVLGCRIGGSRHTRPRKGGRANSGNNPAACRLAIQATVNL
jgi:hypothetical protein